MAERRCACGRPLHYSDEKARVTVERLNELAGTPLIKVTVGGRAWRVPRHYIALHGLKADELPRLALRLGFSEVPPDLGRPAGYHFRFRRA
jgi:hypothetical protein